MTIEEMFAQVDRNFIELWLSNISKQSTELPERANPQAVSMVCQIAVMASLQETGSMPRENEVALDFAMHFVIKLWPIIPLGAKELLDTKAWEALKFVPRNNTNSVWHNLHVPSARSAFRQVLEKKIF